MAFERLGQSSFRYHRHFGLNDCQSYWKLHKDFYVWIFLNKVAVVLCYNITDTQKNETLRPFYLNSVFRLKTDRTLFRIGYSPFISKSPHTFSMIIYNHVLKVFHQFYRTSGYPLPVGLCFIQSQPDVLSLPFHFFEHKLLSKWFTLFLESQLYIIEVSKACFFMTPYYLIGIAFKVTNCKHKNQKFNHWKNSTLFQSPVWISLNPSDE